MISVEAKDISFSYGKKVVFDNISLNAKQGDVVAILGLNGSGKTTLLKLIGGLLFPKKGSIRFFDFPMEEKQYCAGLLETPKFWLGMTGDENLRCFLGHRYDESRIKQSFEKWNMADAASMPVRKYSMGMRQKLGLIMVFETGRPVLLFDEPLNSLDMESANTFYNELRTFGKSGRVIFLVSHMMEELERCCGKMYEIKDKKLGVRTDPLPNSGSIVALFDSTMRAQEARDLLIGAGYIPELNGCSIRVSGIRPGRFVVLTGDGGLISIGVEETTQGGAR